MTVSSIDVAEHFGKRHDKLVSEIQRMYGEISGCAQNGGGPLFTESTYQHPQNKQEYKCYDMTRDGFSLLVMGFTGKAALQWKLKYIEAFNRMEQSIKSHQKQLSALETQAKADRARAMVMNAENRRLKLLLSNPNWQGLSDVALQTMGIKAVETVTGQNLGGMLPEHEKTYSATEIGKALGGITPQTIGKKAKALGMQDGNVYGVWVMDKSPYSSKEVKAFRYNLRGVKMLANAFGVIEYKLN